ncbi:transposase [Yersinia enterocolitica]|nr:transposase [Yersinia enterocolitica]
MSSTNEVRMRKKSFTHEFKQECVNLVLQHKYPVTQAAETMNIGLSTLQRWLRQYRGEIRGNTPIASAITPEQRRISELEKQVWQLQSDNDLLKKASVDSICQCNTPFNYLFRCFELQCLSRSVV